MPVTQPIYMQHAVLKSLFPTKDSPIPGTYSPLVWMDLQSALVCRACRQFLRFKRLGYISFLATLLTKEDPACLALINKTHVNWFENNHIETTLFAMEFWALGAENMDAKAFTFLYKGDKLQGQKNFYQVKKITLNPYWKI